VKTFALDTSCIVAAVCAWHEHHSAAAGAIERRLTRGERLAVPAAALVEAYAVLTRLPPPHRLSPHDAWTLVETNFIAPATIVALTGPTYATLLRRLAKDAIAGGRTYDAVIAECAHQAKADAFLTFNPRHFDPPPEGVSVIEPGSS
jgi:predicted nucleic acid-binding protein